MLIRLCYIYPQIFKAIYFNCATHFAVRSLNLPVTGHSFEDTSLMAAAVEHGLPPEAGIIEFKVTACKLGYAR